MKIRERKDLFEVLRKKIIKSRQRVVRKLKSRFPGLDKASFKPFETETAAISEKTIVPENAFYGFISRRDAKELNGKEGDEFKFKEGKTTLADIMNFFFPPKRKKKNSKKK